MKPLAAAALLLAFAGAPTPTAVPADARLLGDWIARDGGPFEQMAFEREAGVQTFRSWLHDRPEFTGTWRLDAGTIIIETDDDDTAWRLRILRLDEFRLDVVADDDDSPPATYVRPGDDTAP